MTAPVEPVDDQDQAKVTNPTDPVATSGDDDESSTDDNSPKTSNGKPWAFSEDGKTNLGYPADTSAAEMSLDEQVNWWKHKSRKWEGVAKKAKTPEEVATLERELADLKARNQSEGEREQAAAIEAARLEGAEAARQEFYPLLHDTQIRGYATPYFSDEEDDKALNTWVDGLAVEKFVDAESKMIDGARLVAFLEASGRRKGPESTSAPGPSASFFSDTGQGTRARKPKVDHAELGRQAAARFKPAQSGYNLS